MSDKTEKLVAAAVRLPRAQFSRYFELRRLLRFAVEDRESLYGARRYPGKSRQAEFVETTALHLAKERLNGLKLQDAMSKAILAFEDGR